MQWINRFCQFLFVTVCCFIPSHLIANEIADLVADSKNLIRSYSSQLQSAYDNAFGSDTSDAVREVCRKIAIDIAGELAKDGWIIRRTGLEVLNKNNAPDRTEIKVLQNFITRQSEGKETETLSWYKFNETGNQSEFRYIKAFTMEQRCMSCHTEQQSKTGTTTALSVYTLTRKEIKNYFPDPVQQGKYGPLQNFEE